MENPDAASAAPKTSSKPATIAVLVVLTLLAGGGGWGLGTILALKPPGVDEAAKVKEERVKEEKAAVAGEKAGQKEHSGASKDEGLPRVETQANGIVQLEAITTNLAYPAENRVRLEIALLFRGAPDVEMAERIHQDIAAYMRTVSLRQIEGPRGFKYLREDIKERVDLRSEGRVTDVVFRTFVIQ